MLLYLFNTIEPGVVGRGGQRTARTDDKPIKVQAENETCTQSSNESCKPANIIIAVYNI